MNTFSALSEIYDAFNENAKYPAYIEFIQQRFSRYCSVAADYQPRAVDLGCGTGEMSLALAQLGFDVVGVDLSYEMLGCAMEKLSEHPDLALFFIRQDMRRLRMDAKANLFISCYDCLNYLENEEELRVTLKAVFDHTVSDGLFIFDVNTPYRFETYYANNTFVYKKSDRVLIWENHYNQQRKQSYFDIEVFQKEGNLYRRSHEKQKQTMFSDKTIREILSNIGFAVLETTTDCDLWGRSGPALKQIYVVQKNT